jgi:hypothetical protein
MHGLLFRTIALRGRTRFLPLRAAALAAGVVLAAFTAAPGSAQFAVYPIVLNLSPAEGQEAVSSVFVRNDAATAREFSFDIQDFDQDSVGTPHFLELGSHASSCAGRVEVYPRAATLAPGENRELTIRVVGAGAVCWAAVFAEAKPLETGGIVARQQIGVRVNVLRPGALLDGEITRLQVDAADGGTLHVWFHNSGEAPIRPAGAVELRDAADRAVATVRVDAFSVLPGSTRRVAIPLAQTLPAGRYTAVPILDFGGEYLAGGQTTFVVR